MTLNIQAIDGTTNAGRHELSTMLEAAIKTADSLQTEAKPQEALRQIGMPSQEHSDLPLNSPDLANIVSEVCADGIFDTRTVRDAVASLLVGHLMLSGPPGTGKTYLARKLAQAFGAELIESTANAEWSVFDVVGSLTLDPQGRPQAKHGIVTSAILRCHETIAANVVDDELPQATWLLIDEINRCEIDRAFGALFTALSGGEIGTYSLDYLPIPEILAVPRRFRIIAPLNTFDTRFVSGMSAALKRRFARVPLLPPEVASDGRITEHEFEFCRGIAIRNLNNSVIDVDLSTLIPKLDSQADYLRRCFGFLRGTQSEPKLPVAPAQLIDTLSYLLVLLGFSPEATDPSFTIASIDEALAARLASAVESDRTRLTVNDTFISDLKAMFPELHQFTQRMVAFRRGLE